MFNRESVIELTIMFIYVDDILLTESNTQFLHDLIYALNSKFTLKFLGDVHYFLGFEVSKTPTTLQLNQHKYVKVLLNKVFLESSKSQNSYEGWNHLFQTLRHYFG